jgi:hypothetical protein
MPRALSVVPSPPASPQGHSRRQAGQGGLRAESDNRDLLNRPLRLACAAPLAMMMSFICSCRNKIGAELHIYLEEGTYHKRLFRGPSTNDMKKQDGPSPSWPTPHTTPFFLPPEDPYPVLLRPNSIVTSSIAHWLARPHWLFRRR